MSYPSSIVRHDTPFPKQYGMGNGQTYIGRLGFGTATCPLLPVGPAKMGESIVLDAGRQLINLTRMSSTLAMRESVTPKPYDKMSKQGDNR
jgi:hypothetical protein